MDFCTDTEQCIQCVRGGGAVGGTAGERIKIQSFWKTAYEHMWQCACVQHIL